MKIVNSLFCFIRDSNFIYHFLLCAVLVRFLHKCIEEFGGFGVFVFALPVIVAISIRMLIEWACGSEDGEINRLRAWVCFVVGHKDKNIAPHIFPRKKCTRCNRESLKLPDGSWHDKGL